MDGLERVWRGRLVPAGRPRLRDAHRAGPRGSSGRSRSRMRSLALQAALGLPTRDPADDRRRRSGPRSGPTMAGSNSRSTSSIDTRRRRSTRSASTGSRRRADDRAVLAALAGGRLDRHRAVQPDRVARPDPGGPGDGRGHRRGARPGRAGRGRQRHRRRRGAQGPGRPDAGLARVTSRAPWAWRRSRPAHRAFVLDDGGRRRSPDDRRPRAARRS